MPELTLRQYQTDLTAGIREAFKSHRDVMAVLPTGAGKTIVACDIAKDFGNVMWAAHRIELLQQADAKLRDLHPKYRLQSVWVPPGDEQYDLLVLDETHHAPAPTLREFIAKSKYGRILGLTATPFRLDRKFLGFEKVVEGAKFEDLVEAGFLTPLDLYSVRGPDRYSSIIEWLINNPDKAPGTIIFTPNIEDASVFFEGLGLVYRTSVVHGKQPMEFRTSTIKGFMDGEIDILISCMLLTEGVDLPRAQTICLARQTNSISLLMQMIGRGVRPFDGKRVCNVIEAIAPDNKKQSIVSIISPNNHYIVSADGRTEKL